MATNCNYARELGRIRFCALILYFVKKYDFSQSFETYNDVLLIIPYFIRISCKFYIKNLFFVKIQNKRTKPDTSYLNEK